MSSIIHFSAKNKRQKQMNSEMEEDEENGLPIQLEN